MAIFPVLLLPTGAQPETALWRRYTLALTLGALVRCGGLTLPTAATADELQFPGSRPSGERF